MAQNPLIEIGLPIALIIIMVGMGLTLTTDQFRRVVVYPRAMIAGTIAQILLVPAIAFGLIAVMDLSPYIAVGLVVIAACPGGTTSNVFTFLARGNLALSITLTVLASLITIVTIPLFTNFAIDLYPQVSLDEPLRLPFWRTVSTLAGIVVVPVIVGMIIRSRAPGVAGPAERYVSRFGLVVLAVLIAVIVFQTRDDILGLLAQAGPSAAALNVAGIAAGFFGGRALGIGRADALTMAIEVGIKNGTLGLLVTLTLLESAEMAIPSAVYGVLMFAFGGLLVVFGRARLEARAV